MTCLQVLCPSCHEHSAHLWGWHTAKGVPGSPPVLSCQHTHRGAQDNAHPPARSPCTAQTAVSEAGTATPPLLALPWGWHSFTVQPPSKPSLLYGLKAELPHSSKMCHLPGHQTKVSCEHLRLDALSTTLETSDTMLRQHSRRMPCHLGWRQAGGRRLPDQPFCTST